MEITCYGICSEECMAYKDGECSIYANNDKSIADNEQWQDVNQKR